MIKYLKKLWKKLFRQTSATLPENVGEKIVKPIPKPKLTQCGTHKRFKKSCPACQEAIK